MVDPTTVNTSLAVPTRGSDVGTWDVPVNGNFTSIDAMMGGVTTVAVTSAAVTLATSQALVNVIKITGTLAANVAITLPGINKSWTIDNQITNSPSSFAVTLVSTGGTSIIGCAPGANDVYYDGTTIRYRNMGRVGEYWDYAASTVPTWVTSCTKPPYLNCTATTFSSATYPILANLLGTTTLPDLRGVVRATLTQGTSRITTAISGLSGTTLFARGGDESLQAHLHNVSGATGADTPDHTHSYTAPNGTGSGGGGAFGVINGIASNTGGASVNHAHPINVNSATVGAGGSQNIPPTTIAGITMIRAE